LDNKSDLLKSLRIERGSGEGQAPARKASWIAPAIVAVVALGIGLAGGWMLKRPKPAPAAAPAPAASSTATGKSAPAGGLIASGYVVARRQATVAAEVTGRLVEVRVEEGQPVQAGEVLAVLEPTLAQAELRTSRARVASAEADLAEAARVLNRARELSKQGFATQASLTAAQARHDQALAQLNASRAETQHAQAQLSRYLIRAPFSGVVTNKAAQPGEIISPISAGGGFTRTGVCTIVDMTSLEIEVDVSEAYIAKVHQDQKVSAVLDAYPDVTFDAHVIATIPSADRSKATVRVRIGFDRLDPRILPEMAISVRFLDPKT
jgi:HlyD family secretion protein